MDGILAHYISAWAFDPALQLELLRPFLKIMYSNKLFSSIFYVCVFSSYQLIYASQSGNETARTQDY